jgi:hypothetical protein
LRGRAGPALAVSLLAERGRPRHVKPRLDLPAAWTTEAPGASAPDDAAARARGGCAGDPRSTSCARA